MVEVGDCEFVAGSIFVGLNQFETKGGIIESLNHFRVQAKRDFF